MCRCPDMPECKMPDCTNKSDCDTGGFCSDHDPFNWVYAPKLTPELWREAFEVANEMAMVDPQVFDMSKQPDIELPEGLVWAAMDGPGKPHWEVRGTGVVFND